MSYKSKFIYSNDYLLYRFHDDHPFNQKRLEITFDLMNQLKIIEPSHIVSPRYATDDEISLIHDPNYISMVKRCGHSEKEPPTAMSYGLGTEDTPIFPNMHEATSLIVGGTLKAAELVMEGKAEHAANIAGGLHHGFRGRASGFCVYNDCSIVIAYLRKYYDAKVLYIDTDAHHGDGVQWAFYDDPNVLTISIHETGKYLFPGTGNITERGEGQGYGFSINVPLEPFTEDQSWIETYDSIVPAVARGFKPDVIVTQNGCDSHVYDPLTHLSATMKIYQHIPRVVHELAHELCDGKWIAVGGGGYDIWRVVPRAWTLLWAEMTEQHLKNLELPKGWLEHWQSFSPVPLPRTLFDPEGGFPTIPRKAEITDKNRVTVEKALMFAPREQKRSSSC
ncbi:acetoin utilization protein AcuC [Microaerobacter geothermalis]|uniref:acetoin utilization protein AcuC n=1 Tax=Microaerobacter geothermalis TaxID=674972 RepID=UPI001F2924A6|nr:acetoin utilization protein AcuC [Microaerobacter geothermalis]MCF6094907.1 acetoin utilization protein AcuC [Microaerobacter geothermalis]